MKTKLRQAAWIGAGIVAIPAAILGATFSLVVLIWIAVVGMLALVLARWRVLDHLITVLTLGLLPLAILDTARLAADRAHSRGQWFIGWTLLWMSIAAMTICAAKLGRIAGYAVWGVNDV